MLSLCPVRYPYLKLTAMEQNIFALSTSQLMDTALAMKAKIVTGLGHDGTEILCLPTYITPRTGGVTGKALVLDLGGTNYRVATVEFAGGRPVVHPEGGWKLDLSVMKSKGFTLENLLAAQADPIEQLKRDDGMPMGYCFSYPAESLPNGDAKLVRWTKGVEIAEMVGQPVGHTLLDYLNTQKGMRFSGIKVINDTIASLFAGLANPDYDAYVGLIVGTGYNMATFIPAEKIPKLNPALNITGLVPVNLEAGNFNPPHLTAIDEWVDDHSINKGKQRFEKAISGFYLGEILKSVFHPNEFEEKFDAEKLTTIMNYPAIYREEYVRTAHWIYERSAKLTAAALAGLALVLADYHRALKKICLTAEGSLFWSANRHGNDYAAIVIEETHRLLREFGHQDITIGCRKIANANLTGTAIAALS